MHNRQLRFCFGWECWFASLQWINIYHLEYLSKRLNVFASSLLFLLFFNSELYANDVDVRFDTFSIRNYIQIRLTTLELWLDDFFSLLFLRLLQWKNPLKRKSDEIRQLCSPFPMQKRWRFYHFNELLSHETNVQALRNNLNFNTVILVNNGKRQETGRKECLCNLIGFLLSIVVCMVTVSVCVEHYCSDFAVGFQRAAPWEWVGIKATKSNIKENLQTGLICVVVVVGWIVNNFASESR